MTRRFQPHDPVDGTRWPLSIRRILSSYQYVESCLHFVKTIVQSYSPAPTITTLTPVGFGFGVAVDGDAAEPFSSAMVDADGNL